MKDNTLCVNVWLDPPFTDPKLRAEWTKAASDFLRPLSAPNHHDLEAAVTFADGKTGARHMRRVG